MINYIKSPVWKVIAVILLAGSTACKKFVQIAPPSSQITDVTVYSNNGSAAAVMTGLYNRMSYPPALSSAPIWIGFNMGLAADELTDYDASDMYKQQFYTNALTSGTQQSPNYYFWPELYYEIYVTNAAIAGVLNSSGVLSASTKQQIIGEAEFMRGFFDFYCTNLYGDIPLSNSTSYQQNDSVSRTPQQLVYKQIISDLKDAESKLSARICLIALGKSTAERTRPNRGAASALLARVYLYTQNWDSAAMEATKVIENSSLYSLDSLDNVFLANSTEAIWQLQPTSQGVNSWDAEYYVLLGEPGSGEGVALSSYLVNAFDSNDERKAHWVGAFTDDSINYYYYAYKYKVWEQGDPLSEYTMVMRLAEQYLIRAEARAELRDFGGAASDLNTIRTRAGLPSTTANDLPSLLTAILHERQVELFTEWGHRWFDPNSNG